MAYAGNLVIVGRGIFGFVVAVDSQVDIEPLHQGFRFHERGASLASKAALITLVPTQEVAITSARRFDCYLRHANSCASLSRRLGSHQRAFIEKSVDGDST